MISWLTLLVLAAPPWTPMGEAQRADVMAHLKKKGVQTSIHYPPIHHFESFREDAHGNPPVLPRTENLAARELTLPFYPTMGKAELDLVIESLAEAIPSDLRASA